MIFIVGIDPGIRGGWCKVTECGQVLDYGIFPINKLGIYKFPEVGKLLNTWRDVVLVVVEEQTALPGNPVRSLAQQCAGYGMLMGQIHGHLYCFNIETVSSSKWTGGLMRAGYARSKRETGIKVTQGEKFRRASGLLDCAHDGVLDAAGIALWKAWSMNGELKNRRLKMAQEQGRKSLADEWVGT